MERLLPGHRRCTKHPLPGGPRPADERCAPVPTTLSIPSGRRYGLTLIELLLTIAILGILAAILIPQLTGDLPERLNSGAQVVSADLDYARSLAVANNSSYRITFDPTNNLYYLRHSGTNPNFNPLPASPFRQTDDPVDQQTTKLSALPLSE